VRGLESSLDAGEMDKLHGASIGIIVECEGGMMVIPDYKSARVLDKDGKEIKKFQGTSSHFANFLKAVHSRKRSDLHADILEGHLSSSLCHTANISYRMGKNRSPGEIRDAIKDNKDLSEMLGRMEEHLAANKVDLKKTPVKLGVALTMDPRAEKFLNNSDANQYLTREYRQPFVVPEIV
jgi:hypothetical protein